jgi:hypothetical protein
MGAKSINHSPTLRGRERQKAIQCRGEMRASGLAAWFVPLAQLAQRRMHTQVAVLAKPLEFSLSDGIDQLHFDSGTHKRSFSLLHPLDPRWRETGTLRILDLLSGSRRLPVTVVGEARDLRSQVGAYCYPRQGDRGALSTYAVASPCLENEWPYVGIPHPPNLLFEIGHCTPTSGGLSGCRQHTGLMAGDEVRPRS